MLVVADQLPDWVHAEEPKFCRQTTTLHQLTRAQTRQESQDWARVKPQSLDTSKGEGFLLDELLPTFVTTNFVIAGQWNTKADDRCLFALSLRHALECDVTCWSVESMTPRTNKDTVIPITRSQFGLIMELNRLNQLLLPLSCASHDRVEGEESNKQQSTRRCIKRSAMLEL